MSGGILGCDWLLGVHQFLMKNIYIVVVVQVSQ